MNKFINIFSLCVCLSLSNHAFGKYWSGEHFSVLQQAANKNDTDAQVALGQKYEKGNGVPHDYKQTVVWCRKAADLGNANAYNFLGSMYFYGRGLSQDDTGCGLISESG